LRESVVYPKEIKNNITDNTKEESNNNKSKGNNNDTQQPRTKSPNEELSRADWFWFWFLVMGILLWFLT
jgi:hypothetical protein